MFACFLRKASRWLLINDRVEMKTGFESISAKKATASGYAKDGARVHGGGVSFLFNLVRRNTTSAQLQSKNLKRTDAKLNKNSQRMRYGNSKTWCICQSRRRGITRAAHVYVCIVTRYDLDGKKPACGRLAFVSEHPAERPPTFVFNQPLFYRLSYVVAAATFFYRFQKHVHCFA